MWLFFFIVLDDTRCAQHAGMFYTLWPSSKYLLIHSLQKNHYFPVHTQLSERTSRLALPGSAWAGLLHARSSPAPEAPPPPPPLLRWHHKTSHGHPIHQIFCRQGKKRKKALPKLNGVEGGLGLKPQRLCVSTPQLRATHRIFNHRQQKNKRLRSWSHLSEEDELNQEERGRKIMLLKVTVTGGSSCWREDFYLSDNDGLSLFFCSTDLYQSRVFNVIIGTSLGCELLYSSSIILLYVTLSHLYIDIR